MLLNLYDIENGIITIGGVNIEQLNIFELISVVPQESFIIKNKTLKYNIEFFINKTLDIEKTNKLLSIFDLNYKLEDEITGLSGGQMKRLSLIRVLLSDSKIIILDEAFTGLDSILKQNITEYTFEILKDKTIILITHDEKLKHQNNFIMWNL